MRTSLSSLALFMAFLVTPASLELVEELVHVTTTGHSAHDTDEDHEPAGDEHGCSGSFHACQCHAPVSFLVATSPVVAKRVLRTTATQWPVTDDLRVGFSASVFRPPIA